MAVLRGALRLRRTFRLTLLLSCVVIVACLHGQALGSVIGLRQAGNMNYARQAVDGTASSGQKEFRMPPQMPPVWNATADSVVADMKKVIADDRAFVDKLVKDVKPEDATFENVMIPNAQSQNRVGLQTSILTFYNSIASDKAVRDASNDAQNLWNQYSTEVNMRQDYFALVDAVFKKNEPGLDSESQRLLKMSHQDFINSGMGLPDGGPDRDRYKNITDRIKELETEFSRNMNEDNSSIWLTPEELDGAPKATVDTFEKGTGENEGKLRLILRSPDFGLIFKFIKSPDVRKRISLADDNRLPENVPLLKEAVVLRDEGARLLGYPNHAAFKLTERMRNTTESVNGFLAELRQRLTPRGEEELRNVTELKKADTNRPDKNDDTLYSWDMAWYTNLFLEQHYHIDSQKIREYFPSTVVIDKMMGLYSQLFGLDFVEVKGADRDKISATGKGADVVWHEDVQIFSVWDSEAEGSGFVGYLYLDLFPRDGKYGHAANFNLEPGFVDLDSPDRKQRHYPVTALVCNFPKPTASTPSLMARGEVETIFHELGHGIHNLVSRTTYSYFSGTNVLWDFVEAPSQMLENWSWNPTVLKNISQHYSYLSDEYKKAWQDANNGSTEQPEEHMPDDMIANLISIKNYNGALGNLGQVGLGMYDMILHTPATHQAIEQLDTTVVWNQNSKNVSLVNGPEVYIKDESKKWTWGHGQSTFGHLMGGYDAGYYGYLSSQVYAEDMFYTVFAKDPFSSEEGRRYRHTILEKGGSVDPLVLLTEFLGRPPNQDAFFKDMGFNLRTD